jgi:hypothetical protein
MDEDSISCLMKEIEDLNSKRKKNFDFSENHLTGRVLIKDKIGNVFEMIRECFIVFTENFSLEALVIHLFWSE